MGPASRSCAAMWTQRLDQGDPRGAGVCWPHARLSGPHVGLKGGALELYTSRWACKDLAKIDAVKVGISRGVPRWTLRYKYRMLRPLAPSREAFALHERVEFERVYRAGLEEIGAQTILAKLERISAEGGSRPLVLLCYEDVLGGAWCHRQIAAEWIQERLGIEVPELEPGMLPEVELSRQSRLF